MDITEKYEKISQINKFLKKQSTIMLTLKINYLDFFTDIY